MWWLKVEIVGISTHRWNRKNLAELPPLRWKLDLIFSRWNLPPRHITTLRWVKPPHMKSGIVTYYFNSVSVLFYTVGGCIHPLFMLLHARADAVYTLYERWHKGQLRCLSILPFIIGSLWSRCILFSL